MESDDRVDGVRLQAKRDERDGPPSDDAALLHRFSPEFVLFPDGTEGAAPPFSNGTSDYHPRPVSAFLDGARPYVSTPSGPVAIVYLLAVIALAVGASAFVLLLIVAFDAAMKVGPVALAAAFVVLALGRVLSTAPPRDQAALRRGLAAGASMSRRGIRRTRVDPPVDDLWARDAWRDYLRRVVDSPDYPRTIYGRVVPWQDERYLEYWQFYVFNDWHNRHEADWELVVVRVAQQDGDWAPRSAAYSSHYGGHWRPWGELESRDGHPVVYVARGSHAQYFESRRSGYQATLTQPLDLLDLHIQLSVQRNPWTDVVPATIAPEAETYRIAEVPAHLERDGWSPADWDAWWWLRFDGDWGGRDAVAGPRYQEPKWLDPREWVRLSVLRDRPAEDEAFAPAAAP